MSSLGKLLRRRHGVSRAYVLVEYVLITVIVTVTMVAVLMPTTTSGFRIYDAMRSAYRRAVVVVSVPLL